MIEQSLTSLVVDAMAITEQQLAMEEEEEEEKKRVRRRRVLLLWTNLTIQFVNLGYQNLLDYTRVLLMIREKVTCVHLCVYILRVILLILHIQMFLLLDK